MAKVGTKIKESLIFWSMHHPDGTVSVLLSKLSMNSEEIYETKRSERILFVRADLAHSIENLQII